MDSKNTGRSDAAVTDLELKSVNHSFGDLRVLHDLSLKVYEGELCCLLGPSGCGKTTALKIINGLLDPESGAVILAGEDITRVPCQKRNLGMVFQNYALFPHLNVFENVAYGLNRRGVPKAEIRTRVAGALSLVRLSEYETRRIHELSGGQQQRIALARSLVIEPRLLLLDEPLSNLDARLRADMRDEIRRIQRQLALTTVYVTHDQEEAMSIADRIIVMNNGEIEQEGSPRDIYERPANGFVADFIGRVNSLQGTVSYGKLEQAGLRLDLPPGRKFQEGSELTISVRPERVKVFREDAPEATFVVRDLTYLGSTVRYILAWNAAESVNPDIIAELSAAGEELQVGDPVTIDIDPSDMHVF